MKDRNLRAKPLSSKRSSVLRSWQAGSLTVYDLCRRDPFRERDNKVMMPDPVRWIFSALFIARRWGMIYKLAIGMR